MEHGQRVRPDGVENGFAQRVRPDSVENGSGQLVVIGGGAAGMMAAIQAAEQGVTVTLLEPGERLGKKLNITGKGRCNLTNDADLSTILAHIPNNGRFLYSALTRFGPPETMTFFETLGVRLKVERGRRVFPASDRAFDISAALERRLKQLRVQIIRDRAVSIDTRSNIVTGVRGTYGSYPAQCVILATGGISYPATGSTGEGHRIARELGHTVTPLRGSLVPLRERGNMCARMQGLTLRNIRLTAWEGPPSSNDTGKYPDGAGKYPDPGKHPDTGKHPDGTEEHPDGAGKHPDSAGKYPDMGEHPDGWKKIWTGFGELLFTHFGVSGPLILTASAHMREWGKQTYRLELDLKPALDDAALDRRLVSDFKKYANREFQNALDDLLPRKMIPVVVDLSGIDGVRKVNGLTRVERRRLLELLRRFPIDIAGTRPVTEAVVTAGGVDVREVKPSTMESRRVEGLYFAGELLDIDAYTGGYNLQLAWSTGYTAGNAAAKRILENIGRHESETTGGK